MVDAQHDIAVHLDEAAIAVIGEARIAGALGQALDGLVVEAEIEHGIHHAGHRGARARADRDQQRIVRDRRISRRSSCSICAQRRIDLVLSVRRDSVSLLA